MQRCAPWAGWSAEREERVERESGESKRTLAREPPRNAADGLPRSLSLSLSLSTPYNNIIIILFFSSEPPRQSVLSTNGIPPVPTVSPNDPDLISRLSPRFRLPHWRGWHSLTLESLDSFPIPIAMRLRFPVGLPIFREPRRVVIARFSAP